ncbi:hypothetical protein RHEC894_PB00060 (plasmid) [Rhizobium sp. CIAT894]|nr:hypothetical protein RHEC894_PB00060 [Rhizobium sp. CIAT894]
MAPVWSRPGRGHLCGAAGEVAACWRTPRGLTVQGRDWIRDAGQESGIGNANGLELSLIRSELQANHPIIRSVGG